MASTDEDGPSCCTLLPIARLADKLNEFNEDTREQWRINRAIERQLKRDKKRDLGEWKLLLLGRYGWDV